MTLILYGRKVRDQIAKQLRTKIKKLNQPPRLAIIQVGNLAASNLYIKRKIKFAEDIGAEVKHYLFPAQISQNKLLTKIKKLNRTKNIHGIIVQLPLPEKISREEVVAEIDLKKDVDGLKSSSHFRPATARGVLALLDYYKVKIAGQKAVVVGRSALVGKPIALALLARGATVTICHRQTKDLAQETKLADILVVATGQPRLIKKKHVQAKQIVIDVGITLDKKGKLVGDVDYNNVAGRVKAISPVPGGVGPLTVAALFLNLFDAYKL